MAGRGNLKKRCYVQKVSISFACRYIFRPEINGLQLGCPKMWYVLSETGILQKPRIFNLMEIVAKLR